MHANAQVLTFNERGLLQYLPPHLQAQVTNL